MFASMAIYVYATFSNSTELHPVNNKKSSIGMNLSAINDWSTAYPFLDFVKQARKFNDGNHGTLDSDEHGWVKSLKHGQVANILFLTDNQNTLPYQYFIVRYQGNGKLEYRFAAKKIKNLGKHSDLIKVNLNKKVSFGAVTIVNTEPSDYIRNVEVIPKKFISNYDSGEIFNPDYIKFLKQFHTLRFMDWMKTNGSSQANWEDRPHVSDSTWSKKGAPLEIMIALANKTGSNPWFNIPHKANNEYVRNFAKLIHEQLNPGLTAYIEYSNEVWNWGFAQTKYATEMGIKRWGKKTPMVGIQWYGKRSAEICDIFKKEVFADNPNRIHCVIATQTAWKGLEKFALECPAWVKEGHDPCYQHGIDSLSITGYFRGCLDGAPRKGQKEYVELIREWIHEKDNGIVKAFQQIETGKYFSCNLTLNKLADLYQYYHSVSSKYGLSLTAYEGGSHVVANGYRKVRNDDEFINFSIAINKDKKMYDIYRKNFLLWKQNGGTVFLHYNDIGLPGKWGSWGAIEYLGQKSSPKYQAIMDFNTSR